MIMVISRLIITTLTAKSDHYSGRFEFRLMESVLPTRNWEMMVKRKGKNKWRRKSATTTTKNRVYDNDNDNDHANRNHKRPGRHCGLNICKLQSCLPKACLIVGRSLKSFEFISVEIIQGRIVDDRVCLRYSRDSWIVLEVSRISSGVFEVANWLKFG